MRPYNEGESLYHLIKQAIPGFVETEYPLFVEFITTFLRFLEQKRTFVTAEIYPQYGTDANTAKTIQATATLGGPAYEARKLLEYRDIDSTLTEFVAHFHAMFAKDFPRYAYVPADLLIRCMRQFYQGKGTEDSIEWFFRTFFNKTATVYFPRTDILKASDGDWSEPNTLKVSVPTGRPNSDVAAFYVGQRIVSNTGSAQVESCNTYVVGAESGQPLTVNELTLKNTTINGTFEPGQEIRNVDSDDVVTTTVLPVIVDVTILVGGSHYEVGDRVTFSEGPSGGAGYGAAGEVGAISNTALNGVEVINGGDGFIAGLPVIFTSTSGTGASAVVDTIVAGDFLLEDGSGFVMTEDQNSLTTVLLCSEDQNVLLLNLLIEPFVNATATVALNSADYGAATGVTQMNGMTLDSSIELALAAMDSKPFMHPWVFTDALETTAELANAAATVAVVGTTYFANGATVFSLTDAQDLTSTKLTANAVVANVIVSNTATGNSAMNELFLKEFTNLSKFSTALWLKQDSGVTQNGTVTLNGTANVVGNGTSFTTACRVGSHLLFADDSQAVVKRIVNNTFLQTYTNTATLAANSYSIIPIGQVTAITPQAQVNYGKIKTVRILTVGSGYRSTPAVSVDSMSARVQELVYFNPSSNAVVNAGGQIAAFEPANLVAEQDSGQIAKVTITTSGVGYTNPDDVTVTGVHANGVVGDAAIMAPVLGAMTTYPGRYLSTRGFLSADKYLQDGDIYNDYTYAVRVDETFDRYRDLLLKLIHPAGFRLLDANSEPLASRLP